MRLSAADCVYISDLTYRAKHLRSRPELCPHTPEGTKSPWFSVPNSGYATVRRFPPDECFQLAARESVIGSVVTCVQRRHRLITLIRTDNDRYSGSVPLWYACCCCCCCGRLDLAASYAVNRQIADALLSAGRSPASSSKSLGDRETSRCLATLDADGALAGGRRIRGTFDARLAGECAPKPRWSDTHVIQNTLALIYSLGGISERPSS